MNLELSKNQIKIADHYGASVQEDQAIEEMSELTKAILKLRRAFKSPVSSDFKALRNDVVEELADVINMSQQLLHIYSCKLEVEDILDQKIERTLFRISQEDK